MAKVEDKRLLVTGAAVTGLLAAGALGADPLPLTLAPAPEGVALFPVPGVMIPAARRMPSGILVDPVRPVGPAVGRGEVDFLSNFGILGVPILGVLMAEEGLEVFADEEVLGLSFPGRDFFLGKSVGGSVFFSSSVDLATVSAVSVMAVSRGGDSSDVGDWMTLFAVFLPPALGVGLDDDATISSDLAVLSAAMGTDGSSCVTAFVTCFPPFAAPPFALPLPFAG